MRRALAASAVAAALVGGGGLLATRLLDGVPDRESGNIFYVLYVAHEGPFFALLALFAAALGWYLRGAPAEPASAPPESRPAGGAPIPGRWVAVLAAAVLAAAWAGGRVVLHDYAFSMDEFNADFQARIFLTGATKARVPSDWVPFARQLAPVFVTYYPDEQAWRSSYLPGYASIRALFLHFGASALTNPVLGALSVVTMAGVARRLWPGQPSRTWLAVAFLVASSQFVVTTMTGYAMPAHLFLNLLWLWLYLAPRRATWALLPVVGALALGLHNPFPHALFVAPFLIRELRNRRSGWLLYWGLVYGAASLGWLAYLRASVGGGGGGSLTDAFGVPTMPWEWVLRFMQLSVVLSWQTPVAAVLLLLAVVCWRRLGTVERDLAGGMVLTVGVYALFTATQGHGWGYRYVYNVLGNMALLAAVGASLAAEAYGASRVARAVAASLLLTALVQWPLRLVQVERFVRPFAAADAYVRARPAAVVVVRPDASWFGRDLVRNDPSLRGSPTVLSAAGLAPADSQRLAARYGAGVHWLEPAELAPLGVVTFPPTGAARAGP